ATFNGYELRLRAVDHLADLHEGGSRLVRVAIIRTDQTLHFRIFDSNAALVVDSSENGFPVKAGEIAALKTQVSPLWDKELTADEMGVLLQCISSITGHIHFNTSFLPLLKGTGSGRGIANCRFAHPSPWRTMEACFSVAMMESSFPTGPLWALTLAIRQACP